jgi:hypothetical protein
LQNIFGERFDLTQSGKHVLIQIPQGEPAEMTLLSVEALAKQLGGHCADMYFQELNVTGAWAEAKQTGGLRFRAEGADDEPPKWLKLGQVELKVAHGSTLHGIRYLNFYVKHLGRIKYRIGGLLGEDDHTEVARIPRECRKTISLRKVSRTSVGAELASVAIAS